MKILGLKPQSEDDNALRLPILELQHWPVVDLHGEAPALADDAPSRAQQALQLLRQGPKGGAHHDHPRRQAPSALHVEA